MNGKIALAVLFSFGVVFFSLFALENAFSDQDKKSHPFFLLESPQERIFLLGSSHVGVLNTTYVDKTVSEKHLDYEVFNLAYSNDKPKIRIKILEEMIALEPKIVFYGISYRDFGYHQYEDTYVPKKSQLLEQITLLDDSISFNPKLITLKAIKSIIEPTPPIDSTQTFDSHEIIHNNAPFYPVQSYYTEIAKETDLKRDGNVFLAAEFYIKPIDNEQVDNFQKIIELFQQNDIKVVLFTIPHHKLYLEAISPYAKSEFEKILEQTQKEFGVKVYDFREKYAELPIWYDVEHIAHNKQGLVFSQDISEMIISEIES